MGRAAQRLLEWLFCAVLWAILIVLVFICRGAFGDVGRAPYFIKSANWNCDAFFKSLAGHKTLELSILWQTPGTKRKCLERVLADKRLSVLEVHWADATCSRNGNCGPYAFFHGIAPGDSNRGFASRGRIAKRFLAHVRHGFRWLAPRLPERVVCLSSSLLEANEGPIAARQINRINRRVTGKRCAIVWNPAGINPHRQRYGADYLELHGPDVELKAPCIWNNDGNDIDFLGLRSEDRTILTPQQLRFALNKYAHCEYRFVWGAEDNCRKPGKFVDPRARPCTTKTFRALADLFLPTPTPAPLAANWYLPAPVAPAYHWHNDRLASIARAFERVRYWCAPRARPGSGNFNVDGIDCSISIVF